MELSTPISQLNRVGKTVAVRLKLLGIMTAGDLLYHLPFRYDDFSQSLPIDKLVIGSRANIVGEIEIINNKRSHRRRLAITEALVSDDSGTIKAVWFNQPFLVKNLKVGDRISLAGKVEEEYGQPIMMSPVYEKVGNTPPRPSQEGNEGIHTQGLVPNYNLTAGLTQKQLRFLISQVVGLARNIVDWLPASIIKKYNFLSLSEALYKIHFPASLLEAEEAKKRLAFDELLNLQLRAQINKNSAKQLTALKIDFNQEATKALVDSLPFKLTNDQKVASWEIIKDIGGDKPMTRLLEGDVGSGKTVVALLAMYNTALNHLQSALLVPTAILAQQHLNAISKLLVNVDLKVGLITRSSKKMVSISKNLSDNKSKKITAEYIAQNADIIIGTHALLQDKINFKNLALVIVDEQHRFGVEQRQLLVKKNANNQLVPHLLSMTATPIPRSLALALYDDLSLSVIKQQPQGRQIIITKIFSEVERDRAYDFIRQEIDKGRQAFVICPLIEESEALNQTHSNAMRPAVKSVKAEYKFLQEQVFSQYKLGLLHGKLKSADKDKIMEQFVQGQLDILVATSVVEVGIDVPNASVMLVESADRFGLAQLHQYRGRVGRGEHQSYCLLAGAETTGKTRERLEAMLKFNNGFDLAKADLKFRGPGEVYGTLQKGFAELKVASLFDFALMGQAKILSQELLAQSANLDKFPLIKEKLGETEKLVYFE